jgi:cytidylate kinase
MAVVTLSRLIGSNGDIIASQVAEGLGYVLIDSSIITRVAEEAGVSVEHVKSLDERSESKTVEWLKSVVGPRTDRFLRETGKYLDDASRLNSVSYIEYAKNIILKLAEKGNTIIVGRGGQFILKDRENAFHVRIIADMESRVYRVQELYKISRTEAIDLLKKSDAMRKNFIERNFNASWDDPLSYHLLVNSSKLGIDLTSELIIEAVRKFSAKREYIPGIKDRRSGIERRSKDRRKGERRSGTTWTIRDIERAVLQGRPMRSINNIDRRVVNRRQAPRRKEDMPPFPEKSS